MQKRFNKKLSSSVAAGALLACGSSLSQATPVTILNPQFDSPTLPSSPGYNDNVVPTNWTVWGGSKSNSPDYDYGQEITSYFTGFPAGEANIAYLNNDWDGYFDQTLSATYDQSTTYTLSAWVARPSNAPSPGYQIQLVATIAGTPTLLSPTVANMPLLTTGGQAIFATNTYTLGNAVPEGSTLDIRLLSGGGASNSQVDFGLVSLNASVASPAWNVDSSGNWNVGSNWLNATPPNAVDAEADFTSAITHSRTVYTDAPITVGKMVFNNANTYEISGTGSLTLQTSSGSAQVNVQAGTQEIDLPTTLASNTVFNVSSGATLVVGNPLTINSGVALTSTGSGTVAYNSIVTVLSNGSIAFASSTHADTLSVAATASASIVSPSGGVVLTVNSLANSGTLNVANNELLVNYGAGADPIASIAAQIKSGYNNGAWNGPGIISSAALTPTNGLLYGLGYADGTDGVVSGLASGQIEVKYTLLGDANLDGVVNGSDFNILAANFNQSITGWDQSDFNYDGVVNAADFNELAANFNQGASGGATAGDVAALDAFAAANGLPMPTLSNVPEPAAASLLIVGGLSALARRRRWR